MKSWTIGIGGFFLGMIGGFGVAVALYMNTTAKVLDDQYIRIAPAEFLMRLETAAAVRNGNDEKALLLLETNISPNVVSFGTWGGERTQEMEKALRVAKLYRQHVPAPPGDSMATAADEVFAKVAVADDFVKKECSSELRTLFGQPKQ